MVEDHVPANVATTLDGVAVEIAVTGDLDLSSVDGVRRAIEEALSSKPERVRFNLAKLDFMDSTGLSLFLTVAETVPIVEIINPAPFVRELIEMTGLSDTLRVVS